MSKVALLVAVFGIAFSSQASTEAELTAAQRAVTSVPAPEMPAKAAQVVKAAKKKDRSTVARSVIQAIAAKNRTSVLVSVSTISKAAPETAAAVAAAATQAVPEQALAIARVSSIAAPQQAQAIRVSVASVAPQAAANTLTLAYQQASLQPQASVVSKPLTLVRGSGHTVIYTNQPPVDDVPTETNSRVSVGTNGDITLQNFFDQGKKPKTFGIDDVETSYAEREE